MQSRVRIFMFGGFALRANSLGHLEQIKSYAPGHQVRFGSLKYTADIRGDLIFDRFEPRPSVPICPDGHDLTLPPDSAHSAAQVSAPIISSEPTALVGDGRLDATPGAAISTAIEPNTSLVLCKARDSKVPTPLRTPYIPQPFRSNPIGLRSWSLPPRTSFSTRPLATS